MTRPRGFIEDWTPWVHVAELVDNVRSILRDNAAFLPLTLRQIFYQLVSNYGFDKTEKAYKRLCETMNKARRARLVDMNVIRDDGLSRRSARGWQSRGHFIRSIKHGARDFTLNRQDTQLIKTYVWCEAGGMVPQLANAVKRWHVPVLSSGGFDSVTTKHNLAAELSREDACVVLHLGDHDPSGVHMFGSLDEDVTAFVRHYGGDVSFKRIAVTPDQVEEMDLPTAPSKPTDKRAFYGLTTQCEAIPPVTLNEIVQTEVAMYIDGDAWAETIEMEREISGSLTKELEDLR